jgi:hypothetical protein
MIIVLSHEYLHSAACDFQVKFAHALAPGKKYKIKALKGLDWSLYNTGVG